MTYLWHDDHDDRDHEPWSEQGRGVFIAALLGGVIWLFVFYALVHLVWAALG